MADFFGAIKDKKKLLYMMNRSALSLPSLGVMYNMLNKETEDLEEYLHKYLEENSDSRDGMYLNVFPTFGSPEIIGYSCSYGKKEDLIF
jgi:hypothetical protein